MEAKNPELLFLEHLDWIHRVAHRTATRHGLFGEELSDFEGWIRMKLIEDDYAIFRMHRGESSIKTYLATLVAVQFHHYFRKTRGRWRPSATAMRLGPLAVRLEKLVFRDGYSVSQAITELQTSEANIPEERELLGLLNKLPRREALRPREIDFDLFSEHSERTDSADSRVLEAETKQQREYLYSKLQLALASLSPEDQVIVRLHFSEGLTLADVARALNLQQKPLYRRVEHLRISLRRRLEEEGVDKQMVRSALPSDTDA